MKKLVQDYLHFYISGESHNNFRIDVYFKPTKYEHGEWTPGDENCVRVMNAPTLIDALNEAQQGVFDKFGVETEIDQQLFKVLLKDMKVGHADYGDGEAEIVGKVKDGYAYMEYR
jgi:hypothetical protein